MRAAICLVPKAAWTPAVAADGQVRDHAEVVEITDLLTLTRWPSGIRVIVRREHPHLGAQLSLFEHRDGWRYQAFVTNTALGQVGFLEARHRAHARVEDRIRVAKDTGLSRFPSREYDINQAWLTPGRHRRRPERLAAAAGTAAGLSLLRTQGVAVSVPAHSRPPDPGSRRRHLRMPARWPWVRTPSRPSPTCWPSQRSPEPAASTTDRPRPGPSETHTAAPRGDTAHPQTRSAATRPAATVPPVISMPS